MSEPTNTPIVPDDPAREVVTTQGYLDNVAAGLLAWKERAERAEQALLTLSKLHSEDHAALEHAERALSEMSTKYHDAMEVLTQWSHVDKAAVIAERDTLRTRLAEAERALERANTFRQAVLSHDPEREDGDTLKGLNAELRAELTAAEQRGRELELTLRGLHRWHGDKCGSGENCAVYKETEKLLTPGALSAPPPGDQA